MRRRSHHRDVLVGGLILIGVLGWVIVLVGPRFVLPLTNQLAVALACSAVAGYVARRTMGALTVSEAGVMGAVTTAVVVGLVYHRWGRGVDLELLAAVAVSAAGASFGAFAVRRPGASGWGLRSAATGAASFGAACLLVAIVIVTRAWHLFGEALLAGIAVGGVLSAAWIADVRATEVGLGLTVALVSVVLGDHGDVGTAIGAAMLGFPAGAITGTIGRKLRERADRASSAKPIAIAEARVELYSPPSGGGGST